MGSRGNKARAMAIQFARDRAGIKLEQVREQLHAGSGGAMRAGRLPRQLLYQPKLRKRLRVIARRLNVQCYVGSLVQLALKNLRVEQRTSALLSASI